MINVVVTGCGGFIGKNLCIALERMDFVNVKKIFSDTAKETRIESLLDADYIFHLAGVNRPNNVQEFEEINVGLTRDILDSCTRSQRVPTVIFTSSTQATLDNDYGRSKRDAENLLIEYDQRGLINTVIYRLPGVFGKWSKPNYNSVVATFCYNVANDKQILIHDPELNLRLVYIDDVIESLVSHLNNTSIGTIFGNISREYSVTLGELGKLIESFSIMRKSLLVPNLSDEFHKRLYSTYLTYLAKDQFAYDLELKQDDRGDLFEWIKSSNFGQIFVSTTKPGVTRGNHFHNLKTEKFLVIRGQAQIELRHMVSNDLIVYGVSGNKPRVVDIPPGYTHNITNNGDCELITLFWANEIFNFEKPDTYQENV